MKRNKRQNEAPEPSAARLARRERKADAKKRRISVKWKLILLLVLMNAAVLALIWLGQTFFLDKIYLHIKNTELNNGEAKLAAAQTDAERAEICEELAGKGICAAVFRITEHTGFLQAAEICSCRAKPNCGCFIHRFGGLPSERIGAVLRGTESGTKNRTVPTPGSMERTKIVTGSSEEKYLFCLSTAVEPLDSTVKTLNYMLLYVSIGLVGVSILFGLAIAFLITRPISEINDSAKKLAKCDYGVRFDAKGYKEIEELSDTLNHASSELSKTDALQKELIANISHDLRTPLTLISGYAEAMRDLPDENTEEDLQIIIDESNRMKALVNDVLDVSKIRSGTAPFVMETVQLTNCIESELTRYNKLRDREGYNIEFAYDCLVTVNGDYSRLMQVVYNLVNNAVTYTGEDKRVTVTQIVSNGKVRILVKDTGKGIAPEELPLIWDRYYKVDKTHKRAQMGTGLGLSIVKGVVEAHGGTCGVESAPGEGSTFWFELDALSVVPLERAGT